MVVMKFGGTSVKDPDAIRRLARIVARETGISGVPVVVVSAMSGITDQLLDAVAAVERGDAEGAARRVTAMRDRHRAAAEADDDRQGEVVEEELVQPDQGVEQGQEDDVPWRVE